MSFRSQVESFFFPTYHTTAVSFDSRSYTMIYRYSVSENRLARNGGLYSGLLPCLSVQLRKSWKRTGCGGIRYRLCIGTYIYAPYSMSHNSRMAIYIYIRLSATRRTVMGMDGTYHFLLLRNRKTFLDTQLWDLNGVGLFQQFETCYYWFGLVMAIKLCLGFDIGKWFIIVETNLFNMLCIWYLGFILSGQSM